MTTQKKQTGTAGNRGDYEWRALMQESALALVERDWDELAACRGRTDVDFFPENPWSKAAKPAIKVCRSCPVRNKCLEYAIANEINHGIWGGMTPAERRASTPSEPKLVRFKP